MNADQRLLAKHDDPYHYYQAFDDPEQPPDDEE